MFKIITVLCVMSCVLSDGYKLIRGSVFKSASVINLESDISSYTVGCRLESAGQHGNSSLLKLYNVKQKIETRIVNETTIEAEISLSPSNNAVVCGVKTYTCELNEEPFDITSINIGRPPVAIDESDFQCVSENREYIWCEFPRNDYCNLHTVFRLFMIRSFHRSECDLVSRGDRNHFDSRTETCLFPAGHRSLTFELESQNIIGTTRTIFYINHYDFIRPAGPKMLEVKDITSTSAKVEWNLNVKLLNIDRMFEYELATVSQHETQNSFVTMSFEVNEKLYHVVDNLYPYTEYKLKVRVRVIPMKQRKLENLYWSNWSTTTFQTTASKPNLAPMIVPGAYSFKEIKGDLVTLEVYWQHVPTKFQNGPGFKYNISALSKRGDSFLPSFIGSEVAVFQNINIDSYEIMISCYNHLGSSDFNKIDVFPPMENFQPKIRRVFRDDLYHFSWFPPNDSRDLSNYTVMYCNFTATKYCYDSINFAVLPKYETTFIISSESALNFAVAAVYTNHSSDLVWQECVVSEATGLSNPQFEITDVTMNSFNLRMNTSCSDRSLVRQYGMKLRLEKAPNFRRYRTFEPYVTMMSIDGLEAGRQYEVEVIAYDEFDNGFETRKFVHTVEEEKLLLKLFLLVCGVLGTIVLVMSATKFVRRMKNIAVDVPLGLIDIEDTLNDNVGKKDMKDKELLDKNNILPVVVSNVDKEVFFLPVPKSVNENLYITDKSNIERAEPEKSEEIKISDGYVLPSQFNKSKANNTSRLSEISSDYVVLK